MTVWALMERHGYTLATFVNHFDARRAQRWYREHYPHTTFDVLPRHLYEDGEWEEPQKGE